MEKLTVIIIFWLINLTFYFICGIAIFNYWKHKDKKQDEEN